LAIIFFALVDVDGVEVVDPALELLVQDSSFLEEGWWGELKNSHPEVLANAILCL
jgi:hypothetical protein